MRRVWLSTEPARTHLNLAPADVELDVGRVLRRPALLPQRDAGFERQVGRTRLIHANGESPLVPSREILTIATGPVVMLAEEFAAPSGFLDNVRSGPAVAVIGELLWR